MVLLGLFEIIGLLTVAHEPKLCFLDFYEIPTLATIGDIRVGGLSGIDYNQDSGLYYAVSDDRSEKGPARFYTLEIQLREESIDTVIFVAQTIFKNASKEYFEAQHLDFESLRYHPYQLLLYIGNEGGKKGKPGILTFDLEGNWMGEIELSDETLENIRPNKAFESLSFNETYENLLFVLESSSVNSHEATFDKGIVLNIEERSIEDQTLVNDIEYSLSRIPQTPETIPAWGGLGADNGVSEILVINENELIVVERSGAYQKNGSFNFISRAFCIRFNEGIHTKQLLYDFSTLDCIWNIEGVCKGPEINGNQTLIFVSDNNFSTRQTALFLFSFQ